MTDWTTFSIDGAIRFYRADGEHGYLSNLWRCRVVFEEREFPSSEHAYQFGKPRKPEIAEWLTREDVPPAIVATTAHALPVWAVKQDWSDTKVERMRRVIEAKFAQNEEIAKKLVDTGNVTLIEASQTDAFWGIGKKGDGRNMLGVLLMEMREKLRAGGTA